MRNENKNVTFNNNVFHRNGLSGQRHLLGIKGIFTLPCAIIMLQIQHVKLLLLQCLTTKRVKTWVNHAA